MSNLEGIQFFGQRNLEMTLSNSVIDFVRHGLLELGAYHNVTTGVLRPVSLPLQTGSTYKEFAGIKHDWVFSTGFIPKSTGIALPVIPSGILHNGTFVPSGTAISGSTWHIDYSRGRVVFSSGLPSGTNIATSYCVRYVGVYSKSSNEYTRLVYDWANGGSGNIKLSTEQQAYLPCIFVGIDGYDTKRGIGLGTRGKVTNAKFTFDIFATDDFTRTSLQDVCYFLETKNIPLLNYSQITKPLNTSGVVISNSGWPNWVNSFKIADARFNEDFSVRQSNRPDLPYKASRAMMTLETDTYPA